MNNTVTFPLVMELLPKVGLGEGKLISSKISLTLIFLSTSELGYKFIPPTFRALCSHNCPAGINKLLIKNLVT